MPKITFFLLLILIVGTCNAQVLRYDFGAGTPTPGFQKVTPTNLYGPGSTFGFLKSSTEIKAEGQSDGRITSDYCTSTGSFFFTTNLPEGNYDVTVWIGSATSPTETTVKVECRRLMLEQLRTAKGQFEKRTFTAHVRNALINGRDSIRLKPREKVYFHWDNQLTFEFGGINPSVAALEIRPNTKAATVFLAGNSTVVDQAYEPFASWGQMIPAFFKPGKIVIANYAESGEALNSFKSAGRLDKILSLMRKGDYLFIEFAHNDQKQKELKPFGGYRDLLLYYLSETRKKGGIPVLVTSMHRRNFDETGKIINTLGEFPEAMRQTAREQNVALIDLNEMSRQLWEAMEPELSKKAFVHFPENTFAGQDKALADNTHFSNYGAYQLAKCVAEGISEKIPMLKKYLLSGSAKFNPSRPDSFDAIQVPASPPVLYLKPDGN